MPSADPFAAPQVSRLPIVGVMGSGQSEYNHLAEALGAELATRDVHLLTGGGDGVMLSVSRSFVQHRAPESRGLVLGVIKSEASGANAFVELPIATHLPYSGERGTDPLSRNHINVLTSTVVIALPGGPGTRSELELCLRYDRPVLAYLENETQRLLPGIPYTLRLTEVRAFLDEHLN